MNVRGATARATLFAAATGALGASARSLDPPPLRHGPERLAILYREREPEAKETLFRKINDERTAAGVPALKYDLLAAKVGDEFCLDAAANGTTGHWDLMGRAPYLRWALAGGVDYHGQNVGAVSRTGAPIRTAEVAECLMDSHARMMAERPPDDGHRRTVLDPMWTHVGIGIAAVGGEFRMTEEYSRKVATWVEIPSAPVRAGGSASFEAQLPSGWNVGAIEVMYEKPPQPLSARELARRRSYQFPPVVLKLLPVLAGGFRYSDGSAGDFRVVNGRLKLRVPLASGTGNYYVLVYAAQGSAFGRQLSPITGALVIAE